jgi:hypothetical protein
MLGANSFTQNSAGISEKFDVSRGTDAASPLRVATTVSQGHDFAEWVQAS